MMATAFSGRRPYLWLGLILFGYLMFNQGYNFAIPFSKGPDELTHFLYAEFISENGRLPSTPAEREKTSTRSYLPPLYHAPVGLVMSLAQTLSDQNPANPSQLRVSWEPPTQQLIDIVLPRATLIRTADERLPWRGQYLAWGVGRWVSALLTIGTICLVFAMARVLLPQRPGVAVLAAGLMAFNPMVLFISSVLNDDNMVGLIMAGYLLLFSLFLQGNDSLWLYAGMGLLIGLAVTTKYNTGLAALSTTLVILWMRQSRRWHWHDFTRRLGLLWVCVFAASSWWFIWNILYFNEIANYGLIAGILKPFAPDVDPTAYRVLSFFTDSIADPGVPTNGIAGTFWDWLRRTFETSWAITVFGVNPYPAYWPVITVLAGLTLLSVGGLYFVYRHSDHPQKIWLIAFLLHLMVILPLPLFRFLATYRINDTAQGRHIFFPAAPVIVILLLLGWDYWLKPALKLWAGLAGGFALVVWAALHGWHLWQAYPAPLPVRTTSGPTVTVAESTNVEFGQALTLIGYQTEMNEAGPVLTVDVVWRTQTHLWEDYRTELTLRDQAGQTHLRWLSHPAQGRFPTRAWQPGDLVRDTHHIPLAGLSAGAYDLHLTLLGWDGYLSPSAGDTVPLTRLHLDETRPSAPVALWQQGQTVSQDAPAVYRYRATIPVTRRSSKAGTPALSDPNGRVYSPISETEPLVLFQVDYDWPSGDYQVRSDGQLFGLTVKVENFDRRPGGWNFAPPDVTTTVQANFANKITLIGYDLPTRRVAPGGGIPLVLYWQGLTQLRQDYTIAVQLLDADLTRRGGYDRIPRETYNTYLWVPGEVVDDGFAVPVAADAPYGVYTIRLGLYNQSENNLEVLPLVQNGELLTGTSVVIGPIKVGGPPKPVKRLSQDERAGEPIAQFGDPAVNPAVIALTDYQTERRGDQLRLRLIWHSLAQTPTDWSYFVHVRDQTGQVLAQRDGPAGSGYPTSLWDAGEVITDEALLSLPSDLATGRYDLIVGLYDLTSGDRLFVPDQPNREVTLTRLEVGSQP